MRIIRAATFGLYMAVWAAGLILFPLLGLHGYREWWVVVPYGVLGVAAIAGNIAHYRAVQRNASSAAQDDVKVAHTA